MARSGYEPAKKINEELEKSTELNRKNLELLQEELNTVSSIFNVKKNIALRDEMISQRQQLINQSKKVELEASKNGLKIHKTKLDNLKKERDQQRELIKSLEKRSSLYKGMLASQNAMNGLLKTSIGLLTSLAMVLGDQYKFLMDSDKIIKSTALELGLSGERANILRKNFEEAGFYAAELGADLKDIATITTTFANQSGRVLDFSKEATKSVLQLAKGTGLGVTEAGKLAAQFELMGVNAVGVSERIQGVVETSEMMGVNATKVLKTLSNNFDRMQTYNFKNGVDSFSDMVMYSEKMKINMAETFSSMDKARNLDDVIKMSAQLQVLGGEFAKLSDPMSMLFEARNDPEAYTKRINEMVKGLVAIKKTSKGFSMDIASPYARDMMKQAAEALGMTTQELTNQALRMKEIQDIRQKMGGGFSKDQKSIIESLTRFDGDTGTYVTKLGDITKNINDVTTKDLEAYGKRQKTLEDRAKDALTFDEVMRNTVNELKMSLLPSLRSFNTVLTNTNEYVLTPLRELFHKDVNPIIRDFLSSIPVLVGGFMAFKAGSMILSGLGMGGKKSFGARRRMVQAGRGAASGGAGFGSALGGLGMGAAGLGTGVGIGVAAQGISSIADSLAKLDDTKLNYLTALGAGISAFVAGVPLLGLVSAVSAKPVLLFGAAVGLVGGSIWLASNGISSMADSISKIDGKKLSGIGGELMNVGLATTTFGLTGAVGAAALASSLNNIASTAPQIKAVGDAMYNIDTALKGSKDDYQQVRDLLYDIASIKMGSDSVLGNLSALLSKPLQVEFADKDVAFSAKINLSVDGQKLFETIDVKKIPMRLQTIQDLKAAT